MDRLEPEDLGPISPELALVCPKLAAAARRRLPDVFGAVATPVLAQGPPTPINGRTASTAHTSTLTTAGARRRTGGAARLATLARGLERAARIPAYASLCFVVVSALSADPPRPRLLDDEPVVHESEAGKPPPHIQSSGRGRPAATPGALGARKRRPASGAGKARRNAPASARLVATAPRSARPRGGYARNVMGVVAVSGPGSVTLRWRAPRDSRLVMIVRSTAPTGQGTTVYRGRGTNYRDSGLAGGVDYRYVIFSYDAAGRSSSGVPTVVRPLTS